MLDDSRTATSAMMTDPATGRFYIEETLVKLPRCLPSARLTLEIQVIRSGCGFFAVSKRLFGEADASHSWASWISCLFGARIGNLSSNGPPQQFGLTCGRWLAMRASALGKRLQ